MYGLSYPAVFLIGPDGTVRWRFVSEGAELRLTGSAIVERSVGTAASPYRAPVASERAQVSITASNSAAALGNRLVLGVELKLPQGLHVYGPQVKGGYRGISWQMDASPCWLVSGPAYPGPINKRMQFNQDELPVYEGTVRITREVVVKPAVSPTNPSLLKAFREHCLDSAARIRASGTLSFQTCDDVRCYPPQMIPLRWKFQFLPPDRQRVPNDLRREFEQ